jgi:hypothetical protein
MSTPSLPPVIRRCRRFPPQPSCLTEGQCVGCCGERRWLSPTVARGRMNSFGERGEGELKGEVRRWMYRAAVSPCLSVRIITSGCVGLLIVQPRGKADRLCYAVWFVKSECPKRNAVCSHSAQRSHAREPLCIPQAQGATRRTTHGSSQVSAQLPIAILCEMVCFCTESLLPAASALLCQYPSSSTS